MFQKPRSEASRGFAAGFAAYSLWGLFPLYFPLLEPGGSIEILAHRIVWSLVWMLLLVMLVRRRAAYRALLADRRTALLLAGAAAVITVNWGVFIWAVTHEHVVETSLGYFINPLVTVLLGVLLLGERMRRLQWIALSLAAVAVVGLTVDYGRPPWVALALACSFGTYGLLKKTANAGAVESLAFECTVLLPVALGYLLWLSTTGGGSFTGHGVPHVVLMVGSGLVTAIPLILFGAAATRVPLTTLGLLQYLAPSIQFLLGVWWFHEPMPTGRLVGFCLVWLALAMFTVESLHNRRQTRLQLEATCT